MDRARRLMPLTSFGGWVWCPLSTDDVVGITQSFLSEKELYWRNLIYKAWHQYRQTRELLLQIGSGNTLDREVIINLHSNLCTWIADKEVLMVPPDCAETYLFSRLSLSSLLSRALPSSPDVFRDNFVIAHRKIGLLLLSSKAFPETLQSSFYERMSFAEPQDLTLKRFELILELTQSELFPNYYLSQFLSACFDICLKSGDARLVKTVCMFLESILQMDIVSFDDGILSLVRNFALEHSDYPEAAALFAQTCAIAASLQY